MLRGSAGGRLGSVWSFLAGALAMVLLCLPVAAEAGAEAVPVARVSVSGNSQVTSNYILGVVSTR